MNPLLRVFQPLRQAAAAFFKHDLALRRKDGAVQLVLEERPAGGKKDAKAPSREELAKRKEQDELALMRRQLAELLDDMPGTRQALRHLAFVEQALGKKGLRALHKLPLDVLQKALEQFEGVVTNWSPAGLANLRSKMAVAIIDREHMDPEAEADAYRTAAVMDHEGPGVEVSEADARSEDEALAAAYAALGVAAAAPSEPEATPDLPPLDYVVEVQGQLGSEAAKAAAREAARAQRGSAAPQDIKLRELAE